MYTHQMLASPLNVSVRPRCNYQGEVRPIWGRYISYWEYSL